jgi:hypothetical protein
MRLIHSIKMTKKGNILKINNNVVIQDSSTTSNNHYRRGGIVSLVGGGTVVARKLWFEGSTGIESSESSGITRMTSFFKRAFDC